MINLEICLKCESFALHYRGIYCGRRGRSFHITDIKEFQAEAPPEKCPFHFEQLIVKDKHKKDKKELVWKYVKVYQKIYWKVHRHLNKGITFNGVFYAGYQGENDRSVMNDKKVLKAWDEYKKPLEQLVTLASKIQNHEHVKNELRRLKI